MASIKELRLKIKALKNTSKITAAMKMVSAARLRKAQDAYSRSKPYYQRMLEVLNRVLASVDDISHPLMAQRDIKNRRYVLVASDRGLCGAFNNGLLRTFGRREFKGSNDAIGVGRRARDYLNRFDKVKLAQNETVPNLPTYANAELIAKQLMADFESGKVDEVVLAFNSYKSALSQVPTFVTLLPFKSDGLTAAASQAKEAMAKGAGHGSAKPGMRDDYFLEPNGDALFKELLPKLVTLQVFRALLENAVGEHSARMTAMDSATRNTKELIGSYTLTMNRLRQAAITRELIEIVSGAEALKG
jgi:F-type H+-transporting ATPase subunit gamma